MTLTHSESGSRPPRGRRSEHGQTIVLFVAFFSIMLLLAGFAIDQGNWLNHRRDAQKDADSAARIGAAYLVTALEDHSISGAESTNATNHIKAGIDRNTGPGSLAGVTINAATCPTSESGNIQNVASVEVVAHRPAGGLFTALFNIDDTSAQNIGARATTCAGTAQTLHAQSIEGIPLALVRPSSTLLGQTGSNQYACPQSTCPRQKDCFENSATGGLILGRECVIMWSEEDDEDFGGPRSLFRADPDDDDECEDGNSGRSEIEDGIEDGIEFICTVVPGSSCGSGVAYCVNDYNNDMYDDAISAFEERLDRDDDCSGDSSRNIRFRATFSFASGESIPSGNVPEGMGGSSSSNSEVYARQECDTPRTVLMPVVMDDNGSGRQRVLGFVLVYITGCFRRDLSLSNSNSLSNNNGLCNVDEDDEDMEVRGVPIRVFLSEEDSIGGLCPLRVTTNTPGTNTPCVTSFSGSSFITLNGAVTIQTTR